MELPEEENTPDKRVNKIFDVMDKVSVEQKSDIIIMYMGSTFFTNTYSIEVLRFTC